MYIKRIIFGCLAGMWAAAATAQESIPAGALRMEPLDENIGLRAHWERVEASGNRGWRNTRTCPAVVQTLPFFDDFSKIDSLFPACSHWQDHQTIVSATAANRPPTIGTATFDGLNQYGQPYNALANPNLANSADTLTSQPIDLSTYDGTDGVILSYYYQAQGNGDRPETWDSLFVDFLDKNGVWQPQRAYGGISSAQLSIYLTPPFAQEQIELLDTLYFHENFQFRFRNTASITGNNDHWHVDYVYMDANRNGATTSPDVAFAALPTSPLGDYSAVPVRHFTSAMWTDSISMWMQNLGNLSGTLDRRYEVSEPSTGLTLLSTPLPAVTYAPSPNANDSLHTNFLGTFGAFAPTDTTALLSVYTILNPTDFQNNPLFAHSDTVRLRTPLNNYFAYDDGTAETRIIAEHIGTQVAVEFQTTLDDTLRGVYFHLPYFTNRNASQDFVNVKVWLSSLNNEVFSRDIYRLQYTNDFNGLHYVELTDFEGNPTPIYVPANTIFYVGWQQASTISVPIGFDKNNDSSHKTFVYTGNGWAGSELRGSVMMRPLLSLSPDFQVIGVGEQQAAEAAMQIFPNPATAGGAVYLKWEGAERPTLLRVYDMSGRLVAWQAVEAGADVAALRLSLPDLPAGQYSVQALTASKRVRAANFLLGLK